MATEHGAPGIQVSIPVIADFFSYLFNTLKRQPTTLRGYRTALSDYYRDSDLEIASNQDLTRLIQSYHRDRPTALHSLPPWDLRVVLQALTQPPFEPLSVATLDFLTLKTVFLVALASGSRRSEIAALVRAGVSHTQHWTQVSLKPSLDFLAKN